MSDFHVVLHYSLVWVMLSYGVGRSPRCNSLRWGPTECSGHSGTPRRWGCCGLSWARAAGISCTPRRRGARGGGAPALRTHRPARCDAASPGRRAPLRVAGFSVDQCVTVQPVTPHSPPPTPLRSGHETFHPSTCPRRRSGWCCPSRVRRHVHDGRGHQRFRRGHDRGRRGLGRIDPRSRHHNRLLGGLLTALPGVFAQHAGSA